MVPECRDGTGEFTGHCQTLDTLIKELLAGGSAEEGSSRRHREREREMFPTEPNSWVQ